MKVEVIKKGWVYKKSILWKSRYSTIVDLEGSYFMNLFPDRMDGNPSVIIPLNENIEIEILSPTNNLLERIYPFKLKAQSHTHLIATKSLQEREEFVAAIRNISNKKEKNAASVLANRDSAARLSDVKLPEPAENTDNMDFYVNQFLKDSQINLKIDWDGKYQELRTRFLNELSCESLTDLHQLKFKFRLALEHFGKLLIDRMFNSPIPKNAQNGWLVGQLFFYLACEYLKQPDELISKAHQRINSELSSTGLFSSTNTSICSALMGSVEYKGFKIVGYATLPFKEAKAIHNKTHSDNEFTNLFNLAMAELHLKPLDSSGNSDYLDLEGFTSKSEFYVVNLNSILPSMVYKNAVHVARPEFVLKQRDLSNKSESFISRQLLDTIIPEFVSLLDTLVIKPLDGEHMGDLMHEHGINICFLGQIAKKSRIPFIRDLCCIEMISRAFKVILNDEVRKKIITFYNMGASSIDLEINKIVVGLFNKLAIHSKESLKFWKDVLNPLVSFKYDYDITENDATSIPRCSLFFSAQVKTGATFKGHSFMSVLENQLLTSHDFDSFYPMSQLSREYFQHYEHFDGEHVPHHSTIKFLKKSNRLARDFIVKAENELRLERPSKALKLTNLSISLAQETSSTWAIAKALHELVELLCGEGGGNVASLIESCLQIIEYHVGYASPATIKILDILSECVVVENSDFVLVESLQTQKLDLIKKFIGPSILTSEQYTHCAMLHLLLKKPKEAICAIEESITMLRNFNPIYTLHPLVLDQLLANNLFWLAESYRDIGDIDAALKYSKEAKLYLDKCGEMSTGSIECISQFSFIVLKKCSFKIGVLEEIVVPNIRKLYATTMGMLDKVFKFVRSNKSVPYVYPPNTPYLVSKSLIYSSVTMPSRQNVLFEIAKIILQLKITCLTQEKELFRKARELGNVPSALYKIVIQQIVQLGPAQYIDDLLTRYKCGEKVLPQLNVCIKLVEDSEIDQ